LSLIIKENPSPPPSPPRGEGKFTDLSSVRKGDMRGKIKNRAQGGFP